MTRLPVSGLFGKYQFKIKCYLVERKKSGGGGGFMGNASASLSLDGTLSNILAMKLNLPSMVVFVFCPLPHEYRI